MSEDEIDTEEISQMMKIMENSSDSTLILNLISPYLAGERRGKLNKLHKDLLEIIQILVVNQMKLQNDFRALLMYLNKRELLDVDDEELPTFSKVSPESMYM
jgi:inhibitor of KinA sporulation pathway (predicted exonuclease)